ncbi:MAG: glutamine--fructose-6-phosphate transaminase (isomerizing) [Gammaproteobacteria bacterium]
MCGIMGAIAQRNVTAILLEGLRRLEYRGYDSAGLAILDEQVTIQRQRTQGKVSELVAAMQAQPINGMLGVAHTRWATHGQPLTHNAHPHMSGEEIALVHNGIIENHLKLRDQLSAEGYQFSSETDSETIAHLIHYCYGKSQDMMLAIRQAMQQLEGAFALGIISKQAPDHLIAVRQGSPLVVGLGLDENFIASDQGALLSVAQQFMYLEEGDIARVSCNEVIVEDQQGKIVERKKHPSHNNGEVIHKGTYRHYMQKEIFQQPQAIAETLQGCVGKNSVMDAIFGEQATAIFDRVRAVQIVACGTSYHAGLIAKYWLEDIAGLPCDVEVASEIRYRKKVIAPDTLFVTISQSGETADTLAALKQAKQLNYLASLAICNVPNSTLVRESELVFLTRAGVEIGVASTKAFTTQLTALLMLTIVLSRRQNADKKVEQNLIAQLKKLSPLAEQMLALEKQIKKLAHLFVDKNHVLFVGRGLQYPVVLEGALKLKEISYIHAEAYPAGELKHGPLALVDKDMLVVSVVPNDPLLEKLKSNLQEIRTRGGQLIIFADRETNIIAEAGVEVIALPCADKIIAPIVYTIPLQLLAYHVAVLKGTDVDQPRNLAKSVTVE